LARTFAPRSLELLETLLQGGQQAPDRAKVREQCRDAEVGRDFQVNVVHSVPVPSTGRLQKSDAMLFKAGPQYWMREDCVPCEYHTVHPGLRGPGHVGPRIH